MLRSQGNVIIRDRFAGRPLRLMAVVRERNKSFKLTGPLVTWLAVWGSRQAARQPSLQLNSTVRPRVLSHARHLESESRESEWFRAIRSERQRSIRSQCFVDASFVGSQ